MTYLRHRASVVDLIRLLHEINVQAGADMPRDVAVERPHARVVGVVLDDEVAVALDLLHVTALSEGIARDLAVPCSEALFVGCCVSLPRFSHF